MAKEEERQIQEIQDEIAELRKRVGTCSTLDGNF